MNLVKYMQYRLKHVCTKYGLDSTLCSSYIFFNKNWPKNWKEQLL